MITLGKVKYWPTNLISSFRLDFTLYSDIFHKDFFAEICIIYNVHIEVFGFLIFFVLSE